MKPQCVQLACLVLAGLVLGGHAQVFSWGRCPDVPLKEDFNVTRYFGKWYEILRFNKTSFEEGTRCNYALYSPGEDGAVGVYNAGLRGDEVDDALGSARAPNPRQPAKLKVTFDGSWFAGDYWVLDTDYEEYAMVHSCTGFLFFNYQLNWLLGRSLGPQTSDMVTDALDKFRDAGVDTTQFMLTNQTRCPDF